MSGLEGMTTERGEERRGEGGEMGLGDWEVGTEEYMKGQAIFYDPEGVAPVRLRLVGCGCGGGGGGVFFFFFFFFFLLFCDCQLLYFIFFFLFFFFLIFNFFKNCCY